ncbi:hypothetical protein [Butyrivibrio proteoclasticus]|uniref:hypothetical protein n=1 Tax=Butyrivibrio proteoclasticus TaxID=43305 RepID=UPI00047C35D0|nr:hypothetical protein [Butyrivibrio proteoclasticus]
MSENKFVNDNNVESKNKDFFGQNDKIIQEKGDFKQRYCRFWIGAILAYMWPMVPTIFGIEMSKSHPIASAFIIVTWIIAIYIHKKRWTENGVYAAFICKEKYGWQPEKNWIAKVLHR